MVKVKKGKTISEIAVGDRAEIKRHISEGDVRIFCNITGDSNPLHVDKEYAKRSEFGRLIAPGGLLISIGTGLTAAELPGPGTKGLEVYAKMRSPLYVGDTLTTTLTVKECLLKKNIVKLDLVWTDQRGHVIAEGATVVMPPSSMNR